MRIELNLLLLVLSPWVWKWACYMILANDTIKTGPPEGSGKACFILKMGHKPWMLVFPYLDIIIVCEIWNWNIYPGTMRVSLPEDIREKERKNICSWWWHWDAKYTSRGAGCQTSNCLFWKIYTVLHFLVGFLLLTDETDLPKVVGDRALFVLCTVENLRGQELLTMKGHIVNTFDFVGLMDSHIYSTLVG